MTTPLQKNLRHYLREKNTSAHALEKKTGLKSSAIQNILQGKSKKPSADLIFLISQELGCSVEDLLSKEAPQTEKKLSTGKWIPQLYMDSFKYVCHLVQEHKTPLAKEKILQLVEEVYTYSIQGNSSQVDGRFAEWVVQRYFETNKS